MPLIPKTLKIFVTVIGFIFVADNLNVDISSLLAVLGLGGLAFALAASRAWLTSRWLVPTSWLMILIYGGLAVLADEFVEFLPGTIERLSYPLGYWNALALVAAFAVPGALAVASRPRAPVPSTPTFIGFAGSRGAVTRASGSRYSARAGNRATARATTTS